MQIYIAILISIIAAIMDIKCWKVRNSLILTGILIGFIVSYMAAGLTGLEASVLGALLPIIILWILYKLHVFGAGDIKLFSAIGAIVGPIGIFYCITASILIAGAAGVFIILFKHNEKGFHKIRFALPVLVSVLLHEGGMY